jgi:low temperature requirement protein LtrA
VPGHFAERHGLIIIVALGESIVAIGVGAEAGVDGGVILAAVLGMAVAAALWWVYFDVTALILARRLGEVEEGRVANEMARDVFSYLHLPMVAAIVLIALGMKATLAHVGDPLDWEVGSALAGGAALYLVSHVAIKRRGLGTISGLRLVGAVVLLGVVPLAHEVDAVVTVGAVAAVLWAMILVESVRNAAERDVIRHEGHSHS